MHVDINVTQVLALLLSLGNECRGTVCSATQSALLPAWNLLVKVATALYSYSLSFKKLYAIESLVPRARDINSVNKCINTAVTKIFRVSFGDNVDFIRQMTGFTSLRTFVSERRSRFFLLS